MKELLDDIAGFVWGPWLLIPLLLVTGLYLTIVLRALQLHKLGYALWLALIKRKEPGSEGDITHYQALSVALAATVGVGNIAGVATAIFLGGPGALMWMWVQSNTVAASIQTEFGVATWVTGLILSLGSAVVILGGIKWIGRFTAIFVPFMIVAYILGATWVIAVNIDALPGALALIFTDAFTGTAATAGLLAPDLPPQAATASPAASFPTNRVSAPVGSPLRPPKRAIPCPRRWYR